MKKTNLNKILSGFVLPLAMIGGMHLLTPKNVHSQEEMIPTKTIEHKVPNLNLAEIITKDGSIISTKVAAEDWKKQEGAIQLYKNLNDITHRDQKDSEKETSVHDFRKEHTIKLKKFVLSGKYGINIIVEDKSGYETAKQILNVTPKTIEKRLKNDKQGPTISNVNVGPIEKGVFLGTNITWKTDEPSTTHLEYGLSGQRHENRTGEEVELVKNHSTYIHGLQKGKDYHFTAISKDIFGNETVSEEFVFNTEKVSKEPYSSKEQKEDMAKPKILEAEPFLIGHKRGDIGLSVLASEPVKITVQYIRVRIPKGTDTNITHCDPVFSESTKEFYNRKN